MGMKDHSLEKLKALDRDLRHMEFVTALVSWDQQTYMPSRSAEERSEQLGLLESLRHRMNTSPEIGELLADLGATADTPEGTAELSGIDRASVREAYRRYRKFTKLPEDLVAAIARETSLAQAVWVEARKNNRFEDFVPNLERVLELVCRAAERLGYDDHIYDAFLDGYEPFMKTAEITEVFTGLRHQLASLVAEIAGSKQVRTDFLTRDYPI